MSMMLCIDGAQLRRALAEIEAAEKNGFMHCLAVFKMAAVGPMLDQCRADYSDLLERAHPTNGSFNWGRFQNVSARNRFVNGELFPIKPKPRRRKSKLKPEMGAQRSGARS